MAGVRFHNDGLTGWYGTADAPAPSGEVDPGQDLTVVLGVAPAHPLNAASIRYAVDGGRAHSVIARRRRTDSTANAEYFEASLPGLRPGQSIVYEPMLTRAGRYAPAMAAPMRTAVSAAAAAVPSDAREEPVSRAAVRPQTVGRLPFSLDYLASIRVPLKEPENIGETPDGLRVHWYWSPAEGEVQGPALTARVRHIGGDWMTIRRDGVGVMDVRATLETADGALLYVFYQGYYDLGPDGYQNFLARKWPMRAPTRTTPRISTGHPNYAWLNRVQCLGVGEVTIAETVTYAYDLYAVR